MALTTSLHSHRHILFVCLAYALVTIGVCVWKDASLTRMLGLIIMPLLFQIFYVPILMGVCFVQAVWHDHPDNKSPLRYIEFIFRQTEKRCLDFVRSPQAHDGIAGLLAITPLLLFFCILKSLYPVIAPVNLDPLWAQADLAIHGNYPHEYLLPWVNEFKLEPWFEKAYIAWFPVMFVMNTYCLFFDKDALRRKQYLWSYVLCWIISGTIFAIALYSAGPVFFGLVQPDLVNPYKELITWLATLADGQSAFALDAAKFLYDSAHDVLRPDFNAPSAMPSQHVAITFLMTLYAFRLNRVLGILMCLFTLVMVLGSVILGWHYAVDGYAGIILLVIIWTITGAMLRRKAL